MTTEDPEGRAEHSRSPWPALALLVITVAAGLGFQTVQLFRERGAMQAATTAQEPAIEQAQKLRAQLDFIATKTLELAQQGNSSAALIVEELARRGVTINPSSSTPPAGPAPASSK